MSSELAARAASTRFIAASSVVLRVVCGVAAIGSSGATVAAVARRNGVHERATCAVSRNDAAFRVRIEPRAVDVAGIARAALAQLRSTRPTDAQWASAFQIQVADADSSLPRIAGRYALTGDTLRFTPAYPFVAGQAYRVRLEPIGFASTMTAKDETVDCPRSMATLDTTLTLTNARTVTGRADVAAVYPTAGVLPMNLLKLYVHFSAPMRTGEASSHVRIIDEADGRVVPDAFYSPNDELWDPSQTRLTLLFDPGRIKRGLRPNEEVGLPLRTGRRYRLVIDAGWRDASGDSLQHAFIKRFAVAPPDRVAPRAALWLVTSPRTASLDTLTVSFGEPMDEALLERLLVVRDSTGAFVDGHATIGRGEDRWRFVPTSPWRSGHYAVDVGTELEDFAGNNLRRLFDTDLRDRSAPPLEHGDHVLLPFVAKN